MFIDLQNCNSILCHALSMSVCVYVCVCITFAIAYTVPLSFKNLRLLPYVFMPKIHFTLVSDVLVKNYVIPFNQKYVKHKL